MATTPRTHEENTLGESGACCVVGGRGGRPRLSPNEPRGSAPAAPSARPPEDLAKALRALRLAHDLADLARSTR